MRALPLAAILALTVATIPFAVERAARSAQLQDPLGTYRLGTHRFEADRLLTADSAEPPTSRRFQFPPGFGSFGAAGPESQAGRPRRVPDFGQAAPAQPKSSVTPPKPAPPQTRAQILDELFGRLAQTSDDDEARGIARAIQRIWMRSGSDTADLLMNRAIGALGKENYDLAEQMLNAVVVIAPDWSEGWDKRATERFFADDYAGSMEDIGHVLAIEPRHFGALSGMGFILEKSGMDKEALQVFRKTLEIYPQQDSIRKIVDGLALKVEGRDL